MNCLDREESSSLASIQPGRLWSLLDVLKLYAASFLALGEHLGTVDVLMALDEHAKGHSEPEVDWRPRLGEPEAGSAEPEDVEIPDLTDEDMKALEEAENLRAPEGALATVVELARRLELPVSAELISSSIAGGASLTLVEYRLLKKALYTEIKGKSLFYCPRERVSYFENDRIISDPAKIRFPTAYAELREAGSCYALGRFTGTVLHAMRAAEVGVKAMARALGHNPPDLAQQDWHPVLNKCESIITDMRNSLKKGPDKEVELQFYSQAAAQFRHFKDGWRVQAAHTRAPFNEGEARIILDATTSFYEVLALRLSEDALEIGPELSDP
jgi:hypothetical protein